LFHAIISFANINLNFPFLPGDNLKKEDLLRIVKQAAVSLVPLEESNILHRDIAARNFLVDSGLNVKLSDFGMARFTTTEHGNEYKPSSNTSIPVRWSAPEVLKTGTSTAASDRYSFGVTMWEILTKGGKPFAAMSNAVSCFFFLKKKGKQKICI